MIRSIAMITALSLLTAANSRAGGTMISNPSTGKNIPKTPLAAYQKQVTDIIGSRWYRYTDSRRDLIGFGKVTMNFRILSNGHVTNLKVVSNTSNQELASVSVRAVLEARIPPIPDAVRRQIHQDWIDWDEVNFIMYPTKTH